MGRFPSYKAMLAGRAGALITLPRLGSRFESRRPLPGESVVGHTKARSPKTAPSRDHSASADGFGRNGDTPGCILHRTRPDLLLRVLRILSGANCWIVQYVGSNPFAVPPPEDEVAMTESGAGKLKASTSTRGGPSATDAAAHAAVTVAD